MKIIRNIVRIDEDLCNGCGQCVLDCAEGAIRIENGKAKVIADMLCDGLGACLGGCPTGALTIEQREADAYDEEAVVSRLAKEGKALPDAHGEGKHGGCPGSAAASFGGGCPGAKAGILAAVLKTSPGAEGLAFVNEHWPIKLRLTPIDAPFLKRAELLLAADCAAFASAAFHNELRTGRVILTACPKFEGAEAIKEKLSSIFTLARPEGITVARMEVPCCNALLTACNEAAQSAGVPVSDVVISRRGDLLS